MKKNLQKALLAITIILCVTLIACNTDVLTIDSINITPPGGYAVEKLTAEIHATVSGSHRIKVEWKWRGAGSSAEEIAKTEYITMDHDGDYYSEYVAPSGYVLLDYFWVELYDEDGILLKKSSEVFCEYY